MKEKLPIVFRINNNIPNYQNFLNKIKNKDFIKSLASLSSKQQNDQEAKQPEPQMTIEELNSIDIQNVSFYPDELVWQMNLDKRKLKKTDILKNFHQILQKATDSGLTSRQELVSMLPPIFLDVQPQDYIFDMCAAPGSKTTQMIEIQKSRSQQQSFMNGCVVANDVDINRAYLLTHQIDRVNASNTLISSHSAQFFPTFYKSEEQGQKKLDNKFCFDKVLCDVPCSGDGAIRKIPSKWLFWSTNDGQVLHPLQLAILMRALSVAKIGGLVLYSTCSLNPIEDEAVVTELFRRSVDDSFELVDIHQMYPGLKARRGLITWPVCVSKIQKNSMPKNKEEASKLKLEDIFDIFNSIEQIPQSKNNKYVKRSMFPDDQDNMINKYKIQNCMRILPHDQDTGGFFLALFRKKKITCWKKLAGFQKKENQQQKNQQDNLKEEVKEEEKMQVEQNMEDDLPDYNDIPEEANELIKAENENDKQVLVLNDEQQQAKKKGKSLKEHYDPIDEEIWVPIKEMYGIQGIEKEQFVSSAQGEKKRLRIISKGLQQLLKYDNKGLINQINVGCKVFEKVKESFQGTQCSYRLCQDGISLLFPYMSKRKIKCNLKDFMYIIEKQNLKHQEIENEQLRKEIAELGQGSVCLYIEENNIIDSIVCQNFHYSIGTMLTKEVIESYKIRYK